MRGVYKTMTTHMLKTPGAELSHEIHGPVPTSAGRPLLFMIGQPMTADGFAALAARFPDRTVVTCDPRGLGRSSRSDGRTDHDAQRSRPTTCTP